jgi:hypothetical protein
MAGADVLPAVFSKRTVGESATAKDLHFVMDCIRVERGFLTEISLKTVRVESMN